MPSLWAATLKNENGFDIEFDKHKFLIDLYNDLSPLQVILKPPQIGATVMHVLKSFWVAKIKGKQIIYTLPTETDMQTMSGVTINRLVSQNPTLRSWVKDHDTVSQKSVGNSIINYRGTWSPKQAMMIPSDLNIHDEVDASDAQVITQYETRLQANAEGMRWYFSHPSVAGFGVDIYWQQSDKHEWVITCNACTKQQILTWPDSIDPERKCYQCKYCQAQLSDGERKAGKWLPTATGMFRGYHISQLMCPWISAAKILEAKADPRKDEQYFYNYVLGLPYVGSENKIPSSVVLKNVVPTVNEQADRIIIGVDTGLPIHYTCMNKQGVFYYGTCDNYDELEKLLNRWPTSIIVADQGGDLIGIRQLQAKYPGRVYLVFYRKDKKDNEVTKWQDDGTVVVDRNRMFQLMVEQLRDVGRIHLNGSVEDWQPWAQHFDSVYRELRTVKGSPGKDISTLYGVELIWKRNGPDHYCFVKGTSIVTDSGYVPIENIKVGDKVLTRKGYKRVYDTGLKREKQIIVTAYFSNGSYFTATPDHPVIHTKGTTQLGQLHRGAILYECTRTLSTEVSYTDDTQTQSVAHLGSTMGALKPQREEKKDSIGRYGLTFLAPFLKGLSYTIRMKIRLITTFLTWCAKKEATIKVITNEVDLRTLLTENETLNTSEGFNSKPMLGMVRKQEKRGIGIMLIRASFWLFPKYLHVLSVLLKGLHEALKAASSVHLDVVIVGLHENIVKKDVINLSVEDEHEYFANDILVSNCHTLLYALVGLDRFGTNKATFIPKIGGIKFPIASDKPTIAVVRKAAAQLYTDAQF